MPGPVGVSGCRVWYKADALVLNDGDAVATWTDSSGSGFDATQATAANRPTFKTNILRTRPVVRFDGTNDRLLASLGTLNAPYTVFVVAKFAQTNQPASDYDYVYVIGADSPDSCSSISRLAASNPYGANDAYYSYSGTEPLQVGPVISGGVFHLFSQIQDTGATKHKLWLDGASQTVDNYPNNISTNGELGLGVWRPGPLNFLNGDIAEFLVYDSALSTTDRQAVENYLTAKYFADAAEVTQTYDETVLPTDPAARVTQDYDETVLPTDASARVTQDYDETILVSTAVVQVTQDYDETVATFTPAPHFRLSIPIPFVVSGATIGDPTAAPPARCTRDGAYVLQEANITGITETNVWWVQRTGPGTYSRDPTPQLHIPQQYIDDVGGYAWSPDGRWLLMYVHDAQSVPSRPALLVPGIFLWRTDTWELIPPGGDLTPPLDFDATSSLLPGRILATWIEHDGQTSYLLLSKGGFTDGYGVYSVPDFTLLESSNDP